MNTEQQTAVVAAIATLLTFLLVHFGISGIEGEVQGAIIVLVTAVVGLVVGKQVSTLRR